MNAQTHPDYFWPVDVAALQDSIQSITVVVAIVFTISMAYLIVALYSAEESVDDDDEDECAGNERDCW